MSGAEILGWIAGAFATLSFVPQVLHVVKLRSAREISLLFSSLLLIGILMWLAYGIIEGLWPMILWNAISVVLISILLYTKLRFGSKTRD